MADALEKLVLSGAFFEGQNSSGSPQRSPTSSRSASPNTDDELFGALKDRPESPLPEGDGSQNTIGMGAGRTGVKGVIRDRNEAKDIERARKAQEMRELREKMEKASLSAGGKTYFEEVEEKRAAEKDEEEAAKQGYRQKRWRELRQLEKGKRFGHLREVGVGGFLEAVEAEDQDVWVVIHICDPSLTRCMELDTKLGSLARSYPSTKFLRARAATIGFASVESAPRHVQSSIKEEEDEDEYEDEEEVEVDTEMLPTILVYRAGELEFSWVRADWEAGRDGMEELLRKHRILPTDALALSFASGDDSSDDDYDDD